MRKQRFGSTCKAEHKPKRKQGDPSSFLGNSLSGRGILILHMLCRVSGTAL
jgi:hypothetical protein